MKKSVRPSFLLAPLLWVAAFAGTAVGFVACTAGGEPTELNDEGVYYDTDDSSSSGKGSSSSRTPDESGDISGVAWRTVPAMMMVLNSASFSVDDFKISETEVTQKLYAELMDDMPSQSYTGDSLPVENVNWYEAVLFCNALSKSMGFDTVYSYASVGEKHYLENLAIDYSVKGIRLPTEMEWEIAAHGGTGTTYYWGTAKASDYAYYGQNKGPSAVAQFEPNDYGLFDMAGNVAEWVNDWYGAFPADSVINYTGASSGNLRVVRGGGWSDVIKDCAPDVREKKDPQYTSHSLGFRIVYSAGF